MCVWVCVCVCVCVVCVCVCDLYASPRPVLLPLFSPLFCSLCFAFFVYISINLFSDFSIFFFGQWVSVFIFFLACYIGFCLPYYCFSINSLSLNLLYIFHLISHFVFIFFFNPGNGNTLLENTLSGSVKVQQKVGRDETKQK